MNSCASASGGKYEIKKTKAGQDSIFHDGVPFMTLFSGMWDYEERIRAMDAARVDVAVVSLTSPNVYWGERATSLKAARMVNDSMAEQQRAKPGRIRWFAHCPGSSRRRQGRARARTANGAVGVMVLANIDGRDLTDPGFAPVWAAIDSLGLPVLVHPTAPQGLRELHMNEFGLVPPVGFMFDTTLAFARMIYSGFIDRYPNLKLIAAHGGATLPYLAGRLDRGHETIPACAEVIKDRPSTYCSASGTILWSTTSVRSTCAWRWRARTSACCMARTIRTIWATWPAASPGQRA